MASPAPKVFLPAEYCSSLVSVSPKLILTHPLPYPSPISWAMVMFDRLVVLPQLVLGIGAVHQGNFCQALFAKPTSDFQVSLMVGQGLVKVDPLAVDIA